MGLADNGWKYKMDYTDSNFSCVTLLYGLSFHGQALLEEQMEVNARGIRRPQTASVQGNKEAVMIRLENGVGVNTRCGFYSGALQAAAFEGEEDCGDAA
jgi:hypothetical protein